ncbi:MAG: Ni/Fe hydrogenase subunit alpha [Vicinamibacterales bacterium]
MNKTRTIKVDYLARVEGEGGLHVRVKGDRVEEVRLQIFEPPRFFEALLRGRAYDEAPDITARICGICPVAYQMSAVHAMEDALGIRVDGALRELRRLLYCGEWIESHVLHVAMLHAPDFLGYDDAIRMAKDHPKAVQLALNLKKAGNEIVRVVGGREIHPVNVRVGGFYRVPTRAELAPLAGTLERARDLALDLLRWVSTFDIPHFEQDYEFVALRHSSEYPFNEGRLVSNKGLDIAVRDYHEHFVEEHVSHSNALHSVRKGHGAYLVGPMARYSLNFDRLPPRIQQAARDANLPAVCRNPFQSIVVRAVETLYAVDEALRIIAAYEPPAQPRVAVEVREGSGFGCTEAPRGILFHRYRLSVDGTIADATIVPPTSQNQKAIENDLRQFVEQHLQLPDDALTWKCEQAVRNYDPCISCATHFLRLQVDREP